MGTLTLPTFQLGSPKGPEQSKASSDVTASSSFEDAKRARAAVPEVDRSPTTGKNIPIFIGAVRMTGDVIWISSYRSGNNEWRADIAVCFGRNAFSRALDLVSIAQAGAYIYKRSDGDVIDPPRAVRFYDGTQTEADPLIAQVEGEERTPAFKGHVYAVLEGVLLGTSGDTVSDITAEFTDTTTDVTTQLSSTTGQNCDDTLAGVNLIYEESSGLYYGLEFPMTGASNIITSDGCRVIRRVPIDLPINFNTLLTVATTAGEPYFFYCDSLFPLRCAGGYVVITGFTETRDSAYPYETGVWYAPSMSVIVDPVTGRMVHARIRDGVSNPAENYTAPATQFFTSSPSATEVDWLLSYRLPSLGETYMCLRLYDPASSFVQDPAFVFAPFEVNSGNVTGFYANVVTGESAVDYALVSATQLGGYDKWRLVGFPVVEQLIHCKTDNVIVTLAGMVTGSGSFRVYWIEHTEAEVIIAADVTVSLPTGFSASGLNYDEKSNRIIVSAGPDDPDASLLTARIYKISRSGTVSNSSLSTKTMRVIDRGKGIPLDGKIPLSNEDGSMLWSYDVATGQETLIYDGAAPTSDPVVDLTRDKFAIPTVDGYTTYAAGQVDPETIPLVGLITDICEFKGYDAADLVFQNLSSAVVRGLLINSTIRLSDLFNRMGALFGFTFVETDRKLKFLKKRALGAIDVDITLTKDDLVLLENADGASVRSIQRSGANNLLGGMDLEFINSEKQYENDTIKLRRPTGSFDIGASTRIETLSLPITLDPDLAYPLLYESFYGILQKETRDAFAVPSWHARIEPGDCVSVTVDGVNITGIVVRATLRGDFVQEIEIESYMADGASTLSSFVDYNAVGAVGIIAGEYIHLDIPLIRASDFAGVEKPVQYAGLTGRGATSWGGADLYSSRDGSVFSKILQYERGPMVTAVATNALSQPELAFATDEASELIIEVIAGDAAEFATVSYVDQMNGLTYAAYGRPGSWEIISWRTVTDNLDGTLTLTGLQRGLFNTNEVFNTYTGEFVHLPGDFVCILDPVKLIVRQFGLTDINTSERYGVATAQVNLTSAEKSWRKMTGASIRPPAVANLRARHVAGASTLEISFDPCSPIPGNWTDTGAENTLPEAYTYQVVIYTESADTYEFTITDSTMTWADYGTELGADASAEVEIFVEVRAVSPTAGPGYYSIAFGSEALA